MTEDIELILGKISGMDNRIDEIDSKIDSMDGRISNIEVRVDKIEDRLDVIDNRLDNIDNRIDNIEIKMDEMKYDLNEQISRIRLTIDNEINKNIAIIAEGYLSLNNKLDEALKSAKEKDMLSIRVNRLEDEFVKLKKQVDEIA